MAKFEDFGQVEVIDLTIEELAFCYRSKLQEDLDTIADLNSSLPDFLKFA